ncbi:hypothetical protein O6H91_12G100900 [Diphasiastrum complanatum]|uniref:Uncharacterized protein n=1 Tax=Diphasiastrum complanatum TaxID=34168 RepID=A0ACC2C569_DIPCM|nr:hypothetical protein O6H91_12G100900 [Diphasiastrum complanatum]
MMMMQGSALLICGSIALLGIISAALGFVAEATHIQADQVKNINGQCIYPKSPALVLGVIAAFAILLAQVLSNLTGGCICRNRGLNGTYMSNSSRSVGILCLVMSWITFFNAFVLLLAGASLQIQDQITHFWSNRDCLVVKPGVFAGGAILALATAILGIIYYLITCDIKKATYVAPQPGIAFGQTYGFQNGPPLPQGYQHQPPYFQNPQYPQFTKALQYPPAVNSSYVQAK